MPTTNRTHKIHRDNGHTISPVANLLDGIDNTSHTEQDFYKSSGSPNSLSRDYESVALGDSFEREEEMMGTKDDETSQDLCDLNSESLLPGGTPLGSYT